MNDPRVNSLDDLKNMLSAPVLDSNQEETLLKELNWYINGADWFTIGIMAPSAKEATLVLKEMESHFFWSNMQVAQNTDIDDHVFLKANQKTGDVYIRKENGLGEGILISCKYDQEPNVANTFGPLPLNFFSNKS